MEHHLSRDWTSSPTRSNRLEEPREGPSSTRPFEKPEGPERVGRHETRCQQTYSRRKYGHSGTCTAREGEKEEGVEKWRKEEKEVKLNGLDGCFVVYFRIVSYVSNSRMCIYEINKWIRFPSKFIKAI